MSNPSLAPIGVVAHYSLIEALAPAGPGDLYRARDLDRGGAVALRLLPAAAAPTAAARDRLIAQVREMVALSHPGITAVLDVGEHEARVYVAFEFLSGQSLRAEMGGRPINLRRALEIAIQIADGVAHAHAEGFAHRGLSTDTVVITATGHAKIPAFELASRHGFEETRDGGRLRDYASPEEARGETPDDRSDVYSVGAILYEMLTARKPPPRGAAAPSAWNAHVTRPLDRLALKAVAPSPDFRHQSVAALAGELRSLTGRLDEAEATELEIDQGTEQRPTDLARALLVGSVIVAAAALIVWWVSRQ